MDQREYKRWVRISLPALDSSGIPSNNTLDLGQKGSFGKRMVGQISGNPLVFF